MIMYMSYTTNPYLPHLRTKTVNLVRISGWSIRKAARHIGVYPSTVSRWLEKSEGFNSGALIPTESSRPHHHPNALSEELVNRIIEIRNKNHRCAEVVHQEMLNLGYPVSLSSVKRTLKRNYLIKERSPWKRWHFEEKRPFVFKPGDLVQIDTIHIGPNNENRIYIYTLLDVFSRWAFADPSLKINTRLSLNFVKEAQLKSSFIFDMLQSDHGSEFSTWFTEHIGKQNMTHRHIRVRKPNDNGHLERFNRTIQEECLSKIPQTLKSYKKEIPGYLYYYNNERLHLSLGLKTPRQVLRSY